MATCGQRPSPSTAQQVPIHKTRKRQGKKHRPGDRVKLPTLWSDLPSTTLKNHCEQTDQAIKHNQLYQARDQRFPGSRNRSYNHPALIDKREIGGNKGGHDDQPDRPGKRHREIESVGLSDKDAGIKCELRTQVASARTMASAHNDIRPPGNNPSPSTRAPLIDRTTRTSTGADTLEAVSGASKYMTFTTRR